MEGVQRTEQNLIQSALNSAKQRLVKERDRGGYLVLLDLLPRLGEEERGRLARGLVGQLGEGVYDPWIVCGVLKFVGTPVCSCDKLAWRVLIPLVGHDDVGVAHAAMQATYRILQSTGGRSPGFRSLRRNRRTMADALELHRGSKYREVAELAGELLRCLQPTQGPD